MSIAQGLRKVTLATPATPVANGIWALLGGASLVVSYRLHGLVSATALGVPGYGVAYDPKVGAFCDMAELPWCYPAEVHKPDTLDDVVAFQAGLADSEQARRSSCSAMRARLASSEQRFLDLWERSVR